MRATWIIAVVAAAAGGCELVSGLDRLSVGDASTADACATCDAGSDQSVSDTGFDGEPGTDGALSIRCGDASCTHGVCCRSSANGNVVTYACMDSAQGCSGIALPCDSENDCPSGQVCCGSTQSTGCTSVGVSCSDPSACLGKVGTAELCSTSDPTCSSPNAKCGPDLCLTGYSSCQ